MGDNLIKAMNELNTQTSHLSSTVNLICNLLLISTQMDGDSYKKLQSVLTHQVSYDLDQVRFT